MRTVLNDQQFNSGLRSGPNGPVALDTITGINPATLKPVELAYRRVKPYDRLVFDDPGVQPIATTADGVELMFNRPSMASVAEGLYEANFQSRMDHLFANVDTYATNGAIESSLAYGELLLLVTASEAKETVRMIRNVFVKLFDVLLGVYKAAKRLDVVTTYKVLSDVWLEYRYGWRPLIGEVKSLKKALTVVNPAGIKSAYGTSRSVDPIDGPIDLGVSTVNSPDGVQFVYRSFIDTATERTSKVGFNYLNTASSRNDSWMAILGLDVESLLSTAWEMIPFSFVVDMFFNIGSILQVQNSSDQVSSFNSYKTHTLSGSLRMELESIQAPKIVRPFGFSHLNLDHLPPNHPGRDYWYWFNLYNKLVVPHPKQEPHNTYGAQITGFSKPFPAEKEQYPWSSNDPWDYIEECERSHPWDKPFRFMASRSIRGFDPFNHFLPMFGPHFSLSEVREWFRSRFFNVTDRLLPLYREVQYWKDEAYRAQREYGYGSPQHLRAKKIANDQHKRIWATGMFFPGLRHDGTENRLFSVFTDIQPVEYVDLDKEPFRMESDFHFLHRSEAPDIKHQMTLDYDLNSAQWADLAILGERLVSRIKR